jgi:hypothetical protein
MLPLDTPTVWHGWGEQVVVNKCQRGEDKDSGCLKTKQRPTKGRALSMVPSHKKLKP